ncbi:MAG: cytochrome c oxidase subunit 3 [Xanthomonadales bacterium]|nr:cytochrome c oxidase subunit 3 [Xanthomonadales bacterium]
MAHADGGYYIPHGTRWPIVGSIGLATLTASAANFMNGNGDFWLIMMLGGLAIVLFMMWGWFGTVIRESEQGTYSDQVDVSFRMGMIWFIASEVMFFAAFFGALFYARQFVIPWLGGDGTGLATQQFLWPTFEAAWPTNGPEAIGGEFALIPAFGLPLINTLILLSSGVTVTLAHHALRHENRRALVVWLAATVALGFLFVGLQSWEYVHAYQDLNLKLTSGIYGSTFFMLTGFHGLHVTLGAIMLLVILGRCLRGHFTPQHHFGFEAVAWYWHFVDVVWLGLFVFVYIL